MSYEIIEVDALANVHSHMREIEMHEPLMRLAASGGADVLGLMPNTRAGLRTASEVRDYRESARNVCWRMRRDGIQMSVIPFLMLTEDTSPRTIIDCAGDGIKDAKEYPRYRTTQSDSGVVNYGCTLSTVGRCGQVGIRVHLHPEVPNQVYHGRDAEYLFLPIAEMYLQESEAVIIWEHGTDSRCIPMWIEMAKTGRFFVTITAHHLLANEDTTFGDVRATCKPPIKTEADRQALVELVGRDLPWVMAGGDDAFHPKKAKHADHGRCACGAFTGPYLLPLYAYALDHLLHSPEGIETFRHFTSHNARVLYDLPNPSRIRLERQPQQIPLEVKVGDEIGLPFWAGQEIGWRIGQ